MAADILAFVDMTLMWKYKAGLHECNVQTEGHHSFTTSLPGELVNKWEQVCKEWDEDGYLKSLKSPYHTEGTCA
jgi:hypothetical protein